MMNNSVEAPDGIAIIGMAGRFPKARNIAALWQHLRQGAECITWFTDKELEEAGIDFPKSNPNYVKARGMLEEADMFDAGFFGVNPKEAEIIDPQQRIFLECAWEALEDAGYDPGVEERPIGVFAGTSMSTYLLANLGTHPELMELVGPYQVMLANDKDFLTTRVSYKLNLKGPSLNIQTACSTSLVAVAVACQHLLNFQCDMALAGGVSILFPQKRGYLYQEGSIVSPDGHCRAFDAKAQGTVAGEGTGIVVLKRLSDALEDGDHIYAVIKGFAINNDGSAKVGFTAPSVDGQAEVIALAQAVAGFAPETLGYVVTHGTGTPLGDPIEIAGLTKAFRAGTTANQFCAVGSIKTNIGHLDTAAGVAGLINAVLALHHKQIPPSLHFEAPNPKIDFANSPFFVNTSLRPWPAGDTPRRAGVSSFGIGGTNAHVVLEEAPPAPALSPSRPVQLLVLSARTNTALEKATENLLAFLRQEPQASLPDVAYTLQVGRKAFPQRRLLVCENTAQALEILEKREVNRLVTRERTGAGAPPVVFMFPGQGAQYPQMGRELYETEPGYREQVDLCAKLLKPVLGLDLREVLYPKPEHLAQAKEQLAQTQLTQPAIFVTSYALARLWMSWGIQPEAMIGHSVGEYVAACLAGVFSLQDALTVVATRGRLVQQLPPGSMLAVRLPESDVQPYLCKEISLAAVNSPSVSVLSGPKEVILALQHLLKQRGVASNFLDTSHAFHSAMMDPVVGPLTDLVRTMTLKCPRIPYVSTVTGEWATAEQATDPRYWGQHARQAVRFAAGLGELFKQQERVFLEVGPGQTLTALARQHPARNADQLVVSCLRHAQGEQRDWAAMLTALGQCWMAGVPVHWAKFYASERRQRVSLPAYPFERKKFWVEPARPARKALLSPSSLGVPTLTPEPESVVAGNGQAPESAVPRGGRDLIYAMLGNLFSIMSGLDIRKMQGETTFLEMGFDSLFLTQASQAIENIFGVHIPFGHLLEKLSTLDLLATHLAGIVPTSQEAVRILEAKLNLLSAATPATTTEPTPALSPAEAQEPLLVPLTEGQKEIWFASQMSDEDSCVFNLPLCVEMKGPLNLPALQQTLQMLVDRHEALRATFPAEGEAQKIAPKLAVDLPLVDCSETPVAEKKAKLSDILDQEAHQPFDLVVGPLWRPRLLRFEPEWHVLIVTFHHLVCDGGSLLTLQRELSAIYSALAQGQTPSLPPAPKYSEYARQQNAELNSPERLQDEAYWVEQFKNPAPPLELPVDHARSAESAAFEAGLISTSIDEGLYRELKRLSATRHCTLVTTLLSAYYLLLSRLTGQEDLVVGIPVALRANEEHENLVGSCVNFLPLRLRVDQSTRFTDHLMEVRKVFFAGFEHYQYSFGSLVQKLNLPREMGRAPLVSATFNLQRREEQLHLTHLQAEQIVEGRGFTHFDLIFDLTETDGQLLLDCAYRTDLFEADSVRRWLSHFITLLGGICASPEKKVSELSILSDPQRHQLIREWNNTGREYPLDQGVHQLFELQAQRHPAAVAVRAGDQSFTYGELNSRANQLARFLVKAGARPEHVLGVCLDRSVEQVISLLAILKLGAAFLPIEPGSPRERLRCLLEDTAAPLVLSASRFAGQLPAAISRPLFLDKEEHNWQAESPANLACPVRPSQLAYVLPTSGSGGKPHGVAVEHRSFLLRMHWAHDFFTARELSGVLVSSPQDLDLALFELFAPLCWGGTAILADDLASLSALPARDQVRLLVAHTSVAFDLLEAKALPASVNTLCLAGEFIPTRLVQQLYNLPHIQKVYGFYGPPENTLFSTGALKSRDGHPNLGRPLANTQVYILDGHQQPVPVGVPGEICLGGAGLARGYFNRPQLTAEKFPPNPFSSRPGARLFRTGDFARYKPDGSIEYLGRRDNQVKVRGYAFALEEVQASLQSVPAVKEGVVVLREDPGGNRILVGYLVAADAQRATSNDVLNAMREKLPACMLPSVLVFLPQLPRTHTGQLDEQHLPWPPPAPLEEKAQATVAATGMSPVEERIAEIWREIVGLEEVAVHENFFDLGGHSVLVIQILTRLRKAFGVNLTLRQFFEAPTVSDLAKVIEEQLLQEVNGLSDEEAQRLAGNLSPRG